MRPGIIVKYSEEWCLPEERKYRFIVTEDYPDIKSCLIRCINSGLSIAPSEKVTYEMIEVDCDEIFLPRRRAE